MTNFYKLGTSSSTIYIDKNKVTKKVILNSNDDIYSIQKGIELINNFNPNSVCNPTNIEFKTRKIEAEEFIECKYQQNIQRPWVSHEWISSIQLFQLAQLILQQEEILLKNNLTFVDARASNYYLELIF